MVQTPSFLFYDLETFGLDPRYDRVAQFAAIRTDEQCNVIEEPIVLYCRLSDDYLPDPLAILVTHITPDEVQEKGLNEREFFKEIEKHFSVPGTCVLGYNNLRFDDEFIRFGFFRNFISPYEREYTHGNSRFDVLDLVRSTHDFRPEGINWPINPSSGYPSFKLTSITEANGISHEDAHDALSDVKATISVTHMIQEKQPKLFSYFLQMRSKQYVRSLLPTPLGAPLALTRGEFIGADGATRIITPITALTSQSNTIIAFDLSVDPSELIDSIATHDSLFRAVSQRDEIQKAMQDIERSRSKEIPMEQALVTAQKALSHALEAIESLPDKLVQSSALLHAKGVFRLQVNKIPFLSPLSLLTSDRNIPERLGIDVEQSLQHYEMLKECENLTLHLLRAGNNQSFTAIDDVDQSLYSGPFLNDKDRERSQLICEMSPEELLKGSFSFDDARLHELLWRYIRRNHSDLLDAQETQKWHEFCAQRIMNPVGRHAIDTSFFTRKIDEHLASPEADEEDRRVLMSLREYGMRLFERIGLT